jgi:5-methylcytosine-specific restriction endonuclease McrA
MDKKTPRGLVSKSLQIRVFRRDRWLCHWCGRPVIFAPAMRYLEQLLKRSGFTESLAYHDARWRRDKAPLLDHLGAVIDHIQAHSRGGTSDETNFVTSCNKCNSRKSDVLAQDFTARVTAQSGERQVW